jgi:hypothetical protein
VALYIGSSYCAAPLDFDKTFVVGKCDYVRPCESVDLYSQAKENNYKEKYRMRFRFRKRSSKNSASTIV